MNSEYKITNNFLEIISGTNNVVSPLYMEAANNIGNDQKKTISYIKRFLESINKVSPNGKFKNDSISKTKGNISLFHKYNELSESLNLLEKYIPRNPELKALKNIKFKLEQNKSYYIEAYKKNLNLLVMEYEAAMYLLIVGLGFVTVSYVTIESDKIEPKIISKNNSQNNGIIPKLIIDLDKELSNVHHDDYIKQFTAIDKTNIVTEAAGDVTMETINLITTIFNQSSNIFKKGKYAVTLFIKSIFGIVPLIRSIIYLHYKRKADTINSLELNAQFIQLNIDMLKNRTNIKPEEKAIIIKKQEAQIAAYLKKAEKLRAELVEAEKDASVSLEEDNKTISRPSDDDDFILD